MLRLYLVLDELARAVRPPNEILDEFDRWSSGTTADGRRGSMSGGAPKPGSSRTVFFDPFSEDAFGDIAFHAGPPAPKSASIDGVVSGRRTLNEDEFAAWYMHFTQWCRERKLLVQHGITRGDSAKRCTGVTSIALTDAGLEVMQAVLLAEAHTWCLDLACIW